MRHKPTEDGYASITAIVLCAALSVLCAGVLSLVMVQKKRAEHDLFRVQQEEAIGTAILEFGTDIARAQGDATLTKDETIKVPGGTMTVSLRAEYEGRKWNVEKLEQVDDAVLAHYTIIPKSDFAMLLAKEGGRQTLPRNDCFRTLFSTYGNAAPDKPFPSGGGGLIAISAGHDGQVWRMRAVSGGQVREKIVRFLGDPTHLFAVIADESSASAVEPDCKQLTVQP